MTSQNIFIKKSLLFIIICIVLTTITYAIPAGKEQVLLEIPMCHEKVLIKVRSLVPANKISMPGCIYFGDRLYKCDCTRPTTLKFNTDNSTRGKISFSIEYYLKKPVG